MPMPDVSTKSLLTGIAIGAGAVMVLKKLCKYAPPKVWVHKPQGGKWGAINQPTAGPRETKELPRGKHALQLHSLATPNGVKVTMLLEELHERYGVEYDAYPINIGSGAQFTSGFVSVNPNSKIPALLHYEGKEGDKPTSVFESGSILIYLCDKFDKDNAFLPAVGTKERTEVINWVFWQIGAGPYLGGGFGHFYHYAPIKIKYAIDRFTMETKRQLDVLERHLAGKDGRGGGKFMVGDQYTIADMMIYPWYGVLVEGKIYGDAAEFLQIKETYPKLIEWAARVHARKATARGRKVNRLWGEPSEQLWERHEASDFETKTQDKLKSE